MPELVSCLLISESAARDRQKLLGKKGEQEGVFSVLGVDGGALYSLRR